MKVFVNNTIIEKEDIKEVLEPGFLFGWGVFETFRAYAGNLAFWELHIERMTRSLAFIGIDVPDIRWDKEIAILFTENGLEDAYVRISVYKKREGVGVIIYVDRFNYYPPSLYKKGFSAIISPWKRNNRDLVAKIKSLSYLNNRLSWFQAQREGKDEALIKDFNNNILGGARSNIFCVQNKNIITPSLESGVFPGVTRKVVCDLIKDSGEYSLVERDINENDIFDSDEVFLTSSLLEVMPLVEVEGRYIGEGKPGRITQDIHTRYLELIK